ncbi:sugar ABC transporter substrate-binding protein [Streptomyces malaysiensis subsp. malaysiensis]|uniref:extracellular solute-binding protein n=1 Tax=Streptomyces malaysiensis TaxID=92644 RepID=UPI000BFE10E3|nr:extracellular solute-binding protein [Streptomyces malaysiensis]ATL82662.1 sugar ABC transporter, substrate-binding protein, putative [Streptomyces malaysiensis]QDL73073.1 sugar ABC transporter substrate-binding protein [Streptomyces malaysiensis]
MAERTPRRPRRRLIAAAALATGVLTGVAACSPGPSGGSSATGAKSAGPVATNPAEAGKVTLTVWDQNTDAGADAATEALNKAFMAKYPNITVKRVSRSFADLKTTLKLALSSANPPDVVQANQGYPDMGAFVKAGLLQPVDRYAKTYGWDTSFPSQLLDLNRFTTDGRTWETGNLYGVSQTGEIVGVYYNKAKLKSLGLPPPTTLAGFETALAKAKASGLQPLSYGDADKSPGIHIFGIIQALTAGKPEVRKLVFDEGDAKWTNSGTLKAATTLRRWADKGYLGSGFNGRSKDQAVASFAQGTSLFLVEGTWQSAVLAPKMKKNVGFTALAPAAGKPPLTQGGEGLAWSMTSKSRHPDVAAAYIDFLVNRNGMKVAATQGNLPAIPPAAYKPTPGTVDADVLARWKAVSEKDGLLPYLDYTTPTFYDTLTAAVQELTAGHLSPKAFTTRLQSDYSSFQNSR